MTFVLDNGEENEVKTQDYATSLSAPEDPVKTGHTFSGWNPEVPQTVPATDMTFTAQWTVNKYKITWIVDGESTVTDYNYGETIVKPEAPVKEGYTFVGWDKDVAETMPSEDLTYTALFSNIQYTMTFVLDNGEDDIVKTQDYATVLTVPDAPTKIGHTFIGWSPEVPQAIPATDMVFTAQWERNSYKLVWVVDGTTQKEQKLLYGAEIVLLENPVKEGYTFMGWEPEVPATMPASDATYTAQFNINTYAVIYMVDGVEWKRDSVTFGERVVLCDYSPGEGYDFEGWESDYVYEIMPAHDVVYNAKLTSDIITMGINKPYVDVYNLHGALVAKRIAIERLRKTLSRGVYIIDGKMVTIRK